VGEQLVAGSEAGRACADHRDSERGMVSHVEFRTFRWSSGRPVFAFPFCEGD
jgi:hypothetical protein